MSRMSRMGWDVLAVQVKLEEVTNTAETDTVEYSESPMFTFTKEEPEISANLEIEPQEQEMKICDEVSEEDKEEPEVEVADQEIAENEDQTQNDDILDETEMRLDETTAVENQPVLVLDQDNVVIAEGQQTFEQEINPNLTFTIPAERVNSTLVTINPPALVAPAVDDSLILKDESSTEVGSGDTAEDSASEMVQMEETIAPQPGGNDGQNEVEEPQQESQSSAETEDFQSLDEDLEQAKNSSTHEDNSKISDSEDQEEKDTASEMRIESHETSEILEEEEMVNDPEQETVDEICTEEAEQMEGTIIGLQQTVVEENSTSQDEQSSLDEADQEPDAEMDEEEQITTASASDQSCESIKETETVESQDLESVIEPATVVPNHESTSDNDMEINRPSFYVEPQANMFEQSDNSEQDLHPIAAPLQFSGTRYNISQTPKPSEKPANTAADDSSQSRQSEEQSADADNEESVDNEAVSLKVAV